ncbi:MAG: DMT family transporter [Bacillota bacterium]|nr:DMT family transporter [Bacillota bacterium]
MKKGLIYIIISAVIFSTFEPVSKLITGNISSIGITCIRFFIGSLILMPFALAKQKKDGIKLAKKDFLILTFLGILCVCVSMLLLQYAVKFAGSAAVIGIIFSSNSVFTIIFAILFLKDKMTMQKAIALILCIVGILICADMKVTSFLSSILAVLAALTFSLYTVLSKKYTTKICGIIQTGYSFLIGSIVLIFYLFVSSSISGETVVSFIDLKSIFVLIYLSVAVTGIGYWSFFRAMEKASAMAASFVFFIKPILTPFATYIVTVLFSLKSGANPFTLRNFIAIIFVLIGSYLITYQKKTDKTGLKI